METAAPSNFREFPVSDYDLAATLSSGQAFRWHPSRFGRGTVSETATDGADWTGVLAGHWVRVRQIGGPGSGPARILAETETPQADWRWLRDYFQFDLDLEAVIATFPDDAPMRQAVLACRGLRLLRQEPWECLASFICSSTKQIVQIRQIVARLSERFGEPVPVPSGEAPAFAFPTAGRIAAADESELRECRLGFRAPYLRAAAMAVAENRIALDQVRELPLAEARAALMALPGVGPKIADCVLLFAGGFPTAFPIDVWVLRALRRLYFPGERTTMGHLRHFSETHFGPHGGYAQQYLFHYMRTRRRPAAASALSSKRGSPETRTRTTPQAGRPT